MLTEKGLEHARRERPRRNNDGFDHVWILGWNPVVCRTGHVAAEVVEHLSVIWILERIRERIVIRGLGRWIRSEWVELREMGRRRKVVQSQDIDW